MRKGNWVLRCFSGMAGGRSSKFQGDALPGIGRGSQVTPDLEARAASVPGDPLPLEFGTWDLKPLPPIPPKTEDFPQIQADHRWESGFTKSWGTESWERNDGASQFSVEPEEAGEIPNSKFQAPKKLQSPNSNGSACPAASASALIRPLAHRLAPVPGGRISTLPPPSPRRASEDACGTAGRRPALRSAGVRAGSVSGAVSRCARAGRRLPLEFAIWNLGFEASPTHSTENSGEPVHRCPDAPPPEGGTPCQRLSPAANQGAGP